MAPAPKRSLKRTVASTVEDRTPRFLLGSLALAMVISLLAGLGIGIKVEQHRVESKKAKTTATAKTKTKKKTTTKKTALLGAGPLYARVITAGPRNLIVTNGRRRIPLVMLKNTEVELAKPATASAIVAGAHVLVVFKHPAGSGSTTTAATAGPTGTTATKPPAIASEIVVVNGTAPGRLGIHVESAGSGTMTLKIGTAKLTVSIAGARIEQTETGVASDLSAGRKVVVRTYHPIVKTKPKKKKKNKKAKKPVVVKTSTFAVEIVLLPSDSLL
jgi:hypothetical protein